MNEVDETMSEFEYHSERSTTPDKEEINTCPECGKYAGTKYEFCVDHRE